MIFEWDAAKDTVNRRKHGVAFDQAKRIDDPVWLPHPAARMIARGILEKVGLLIGGLGW